MSDFTVLYSSAKDEWGTPPDLFAQLDSEFHFTLDVCASAANAKCDRYFTKEDDGLSQKWEGVCWMNPPYGRRVINLWMAKAVEAAKEGATVVCLVPSRTDTAWWHDYAAKGEVRFLRGRLTFVDEAGQLNGQAPFPSAIVVFRPEHFAGLEG